MSALRGLVLLLGFELRRALKAVALAVGVGACVILLTCAGIVGVARMEGPRARIWVVVPDPELRQALRGLRLATLGEVVESPPRARPDDVLVVLPDDPARGRWAIHAPDRASAERLRPAVLAAQRWVRQRAAIPAEEADALRDVPRAEAAGLQFAETLRSRDLTLGVAAFLWVLCGIGAALTAAKEVTERERGLTGLLRMGTPAWTIWAARLITSSVLLWMWSLPAVGVGLAFWPAQTIVACVWVLALAAFGAGLGAAVGALEVDVGVPDLRFVGPAGLVLVALAVFALPTELRWLWAWMPGIGLIAVPLVGQAGPALLALHVVWGVVALRFGAWVYGSVEPVGSVVSRVLR